MQSDAVVYLSLFIQIHQYEDKKMDFVVLFNLFPGMADTGLTSLTTYCLCLLFSK